MDSKEWFHKILEMHQLSKIDAVHRYWESSKQLAETKQIGFIIRGNLAWNSEADWIDSEEGLRIKSNLFDPIGKPYNENSLRTYLQWYRNSYEIWGTLPIDIFPDNARLSEVEIKKSLHQITQITNTLSFLTNTSLEWVPANYGKIRHGVESYPQPKEEYEGWECTAIRKSDEEGITKNVSDSYFPHVLFPLLSEINALPTDPVNFKKIIETALSWHSYGNRFTSGLYRFVSYWNSIEVLGNWYYDNIHNKINKLKKKTQIMKIIGEITNINCLKKVVDCYEIVRPTSKTSISSLLNTLDLQELSGKIFSRKNQRNENLHDIRNQIAHGSLSELDFDEAASLKERVTDVYNASKSVIAQSIKKKDAIMALKDSSIHTKKV